jgi:hypothetical protein
MSVTTVQARMSATNADGECLSDYTSFDEYSITGLVALGEMYIFIE